MNKQQQCLDFNHSYFHNNHHFNIQKNEKVIKPQQHQSNSASLRGTSISMPSIIDSSNAQKLPQLNNHSLMMMLNNNIQQQGRHIKGKPILQQSHANRKIIQVSLEKNVQLHQSTNAWKPTLMAPFAKKPEASQPDESTILVLLLC